MYEISGFSDFRPFGQEPWATVYRATQVVLGREVLVHRVTDAYDAAARAGLLLAVRRSAALGLSSMSPVIDAAPTGDWFVQEYPAGGTLASALSSATAEDRARWASELLTATGAAHAAGLLFGNISFANIGVRGDRSLVLGLCPYLASDTIRYFDASSLRWLPATVVRGDTPYNERAEQAVAATLAIALLCDVPSAESAEALARWSSAPVLAAALGEIASMSPQISVDLPGVGHLAHTFWRTLPVGTPAGLVAEAADGLSASAVERAEHLPLLHEPDDASIYALFDDPDSGVHSIQDSRALDVLPAQHLEIDFVLQMLARLQALEGMFDARKA